MPETLLEFPKMMTRRTAAALAERYDIPAEIARIEGEIAELRSKLRDRMAELHSLCKQKARNCEAGYEFYDHRPIDAAREVLAEAGGRMPREDLVRSLLRGGIAIGRKRGVHNIRISLDANIANGNLRSDGEMILLPESDPSVRL